MAATTSDKVRNVVLVGQDGAGKTSLAEAMLYLSGKTARFGTTADGKSNLDYDPEEIKRRMTISTTLAPITHEGVKINLLDTSGSPDFFGDCVGALAVGETALFVVDAVAGPQVSTNKIWEFCADKPLAKAVFVNHIDREHADWDEVMDTLGKAFGKRIAAVTLPMGSAEDFKGVIDIVKMKARITKGFKEEVVDIPAEYADEAEAARETLCETVAEADDEAMEKFFEEGTFEQAELESLLSKAICMGLIDPVFVGSVLEGQGVGSVMDDIASFFPSPVVDELGAGEKLAISEGGTKSAVVFKTASDAFVGRLSFVKVLGGTLTPGDELLNSRSNKKERLGHIYEMCGKETSDISKAVAGDIVVIPKLSDTRTGDTLSADGKVEPVLIEFPAPLYPVAIEVVDKKDVDKLGDFLAKQAEIDPCVKLKHDEETHQTILQTLGEGVVSLIVARLKDSTGVTAKLVKVRVPYRETIRKVSQAQGRHKKQTGGSGQFGDCWLRLEPNPGAGYEFIDEVVGGRIPRNFIPHVDKGVQAAMEEGFLAGYPMVDLKCAVYDGSYHPVDSNEMAFKTAARIGFRNCCDKADAYILEPMANVDVTVPEEFVGTIMGDFSSRRGIPLGSDSVGGGKQVIHARVPYAEVVAYSKDLRSLTRGAGSYTIEVEGYQEVPGDVSQKLIAEYQASREEK